MPDDGLMRIFWPTDIPRTTSQGVIVGWKNSELDFLVVAILEDVEVSFLIYRCSPDANMVVGKECRECLESGNSLSKCWTPSESNIRPLWSNCATCLGLYQQSCTGRGQFDKCDDQDEQ